MESVEECIRRLDVATARLEEQVKHFTAALDKVETALNAVQGMISSFFDRTDELTKAIEGIHQRGCNAGEEHVKKNREKLGQIEQRMAVVEKALHTPMRPGTWQFVFVGGAVVGLAFSALGQTAVAPVLLDLLKRWLGG